MVVGVVVVESVAVRDGGEASGRIVGVMGVVAGLIDLGMITLLRKS